ncbi:hypothetical protein [Rosistilla carotiformis]|uniref:hypothetical protein n=1 Tax=Rosistilla carotiformis TaxID=2528017 RepID=UPI0011A48309|nr:hypothetical protein [Rosistilla carotiformis]
MWQLDREDCGAQIITHQRIAAGGRDAGPCESLSIQTGSGTRAEFIYRIVPTEVINELVASVWYWAQRPGARLSLRVRFPFALDPRTGQPAIARIGNVEYTQPGQWQQLSLTNAYQQLVVQQAVVRNALGREVDLRQPYIDAVTINTYAGPGTENLRIDDLRIDRALPVQLNRLENRGAIASSASDTTRPAFPGGVVKRFLEYNGESLPWLKANGFTGILLQRVPDAAILRDANQAGLEIIAPYATVDRKDLANLLAPVIAWNLGDALLEKDLPRSVDIAGRLRRLPGVMRRELVAFPIESHRQYRSVSDCLAIDLPPPVRGLTPAEETAWQAEAIALTGHSPRFLTAIASGPSRALRDQIEGLAACTDTTPIDDYGWHATWLQTMRALETSPRGIVFRSSGALDSGRAEDFQRANVLRLINRYIALTQTIISTGAATAELACYDAAYRARYLRNGNLGLIIATSTSSVGTMPHAGNGKVLRIAIPPTLRGQQIFRFSGMQLERLKLDATPGGSTVDVVAPDFVELFIVSNDSAATARFDRQLHQTSSQIGFDRWQLVRESLMRTTRDWDAMRQYGMATPADPAYAILRQANQALDESARVHQSGDVASAFRLLRRADAWDIQATGQLIDALAFDQDRLVSHPALNAPNSASLYIGMLPQSNRGQWKQESAVLNPFENPQLWERSGWTHDRRREDLAQSDVQITEHEEPGKTVLSLSVRSLSGQPLPGGYAGTMLRGRSQAIPCKQGDCVRIDARIRIRTHGPVRPHRGALIYDSFAGSELGLFVRPDNRWHNIRMYRAATNDQPLQATFELIGEGELQLEQFSVAKWVPKSAALPIRPLNVERSDTLISEPAR